MFEYRIADAITGRLVAEGCSTQVSSGYAAGESWVVPGEVVERMEDMQRMPLHRV